MANTTFEDDRDEAASQLELALELVTGEEAEALEPPFEVLESDEELEIRVFLAGVEVGDVRVLAAEDEVHVEGKIREPGFGRLHRDAVRCGTFRRRVCLPFPVAPEERVVTLCGGVLHITLPRVRYHS